MPIQWYKRPDGTWVLWNTDSPEAQPISIPSQAPPTDGTPSGPQAGTAGATAEAAASSVEQARDPNLSEYGFKLKPTSDDRKFVHNAVKDLQKGDLTDEERHKLAMSMLEQHLYSITDGGDVYGSFRHNPGGKGGTQAILDLLGDFKDTADNELGKLGMDTSKLSTEEIINAFRNKDQLLSEKPSRTSGDTRSAIESQMEQAASMGAQFQLGAWHQVGGEEE